MTVSIEDDPDRTLVSLLVNGQDVTSQVKDGQYIIKNVTGNVTVEATFKSTKEFITLTGEYAGPQLHRQRPARLHRIGLQQADEPGTADPRL